MLNLQFNGYLKSYRTSYVATLPCETLMPAKQAINDKLQGSVATHLRCGEVFNNQIKKGYLDVLLPLRYEVGGVAQW